MFSMPLPAGGVVSDVDIYPTYPALDKPYCVRFTHSDLASSVISEDSAHLSCETPYVQRTFKHASKDAEWLLMDYQHIVKLPNRFHTAAQYSFDGSPLPGIILDGPLPQHASPNRTRWSPFFFDSNRTNTRIYICSRVYELEDVDNHITVTFSLFGGRVEETFTFEKTMSVRRSLELDIGQILTPRQWQSDFGWIYLTFDPGAYFNVYFLTDFDGRSIMCGHAF